MILSLPYENEKRKPNSKDVFPFFFFNLYCCIEYLFIQQRVIRHGLGYIHFFWSFGESTKKRRVI